VMSENGYVMYDKLKQEEIGGGPFQSTGKPRHMLFRPMRVSVNTVTNIYTIPPYVPPKISNSAADY
jgi:hypothetical protein